MRIGRRTLLAAAAALPLTLLAGCAGVSTTSVTGQEFTATLRIPPLADSTVRDGERTSRLTAQEGSMTFAGIAGPTPTWGFSGDLLGPTLRAERGEQVAVEIDNALGEATSVHWHGMHLPAAMDGGPHQMIEPGGTWRPQWRIAQ